MNDTITIGMDLGDKDHIAVVLDADGKELKMGKVTNTKAGINRFFGHYKGASVAIEAGTHSPWISRQLEQMGCRVYVGNPRKLRFIWDSIDKSDQRDARMLAMVCRLEPRLLWPVCHRGSQATADLALIKSRDCLVKSRNRLINHARGLVKVTGERLPACSTESFTKRCATYVPKELWPALEAIFSTVEQISAQIRALDKKIEQLCRQQYPQTQRLQQVPGVGPITALAFVLSVDDPHRFTKSRQLGPYLGLTPRRDQSGNTDKQLHISKAGNPYLRRLLVGCAHYIMGPFGPDSALRRHGLSIAARGGKNAKRRAAVAVARKLAVVLHSLWVSDQAYEPLYGLKKAA